MHVLIYEFVTGGGCYSWDGGAAPSGSLLTEGRAMLRAVAADFSRLENVTVHVLHDRRLANLELSNCRVHSIASNHEELATLSRLARDCEWSLVIAPEFSGFLLDRCRRVAEVGRLLGPGLELIALASDKQQTAEHLAAHGVPVPTGRALEPGEPLPSNFSYPAVLKPRDGAGSQGVRLIRSHLGKAGSGTRESSEPLSSGILTNSATDELAERLPVQVPSRLERYCSGIPASVSFLCGPLRRVALVPCRQLLSEYGNFTYFGGSLPLPSELADRAIKLAGRAVATLPQAIGYLGLDLVLGPNTTGSEDYIIEINPRLTTSYVGLRALSETNLAAAMLAIAAGRSVELSFRPGHVQFASDGTCNLREAAIL